ncbi:MAG TPA: hypothetical protein VLH59_11220 [Ignavibacteriaceae bacterium]|nr:hypothetical protein [Ignavibacteriaceae bacterium]
MKKLKIFILFVVILILSSCDVNDTENQKITSAFSLAVGNKYCFRHSSQIIGSPNVTSWFTSKQILSDTLIDSKQYFVFDDGTKLRSDKNIVYQFVNGLEIVYFSFNVNVGDIILFENNNYSLKEIRTSNDFFGESLSLYTISNEIFNPDSTVQYSFSKKFGVVDYNRNHSNTITNFYLDGAVIKNLGYGRLKN